MSLQTHTRLADFCLPVLSSCFLPFHVPRFEQREETEDVGGASEKEVETRCGERGESRAPLRVAEAPWLQGPQPAPVFVYACGPEGRAGGHVQQLHERTRAL